MIYKMINKLRRIRILATRGFNIIKTQGLLNFTQRLSRFIYYRIFSHKKKKDYKDILFINGCALPHPSRYRVNHQIEQLESNGLTCDSVFYDQVNQDLLKYYRGFIFFRCPITDQIKDFISSAKASNKKCFFDIDDLVIDTKYTDKIKYVINMSKEDKALYDDGVNRMRETLNLCDYVITTTTALAQEIEKMGKEVYVNRNVASDEMVYLSNKAIQAKNKNNEDVILGYFSGSITHNHDFEVIVPSLIKVFNKYDYVKLKIAGILDIPNELKPYKDRISTIGFVDWKKLPKEIAACDINLAPITESIFNEAKSENKWTESALVMVPTIASNIGSFKEVISHNETGLLVDSAGEWFEELEELILDREKRLRIAEAANVKARSTYTAVHSGSPVTAYIRDKLSRNIAFILPTTDISGGVNVVLKHAEILNKHGWDVTLVDTIDYKSLKSSLKKYKYRLEIPGYNLILSHKTNMEAYFDTVVATLWSTLKYTKEYSNTSNRLYFVQSYETDFYNWGNGKSRSMANSTYNDQSGIRYITMSPWCQEWLSRVFNKEALYASNGIDSSLYPIKKRSFKGKIRILIEGDSRSEYKNTDEAFYIANRLPKDKFEISYLSYRKEPKDWYKVDKFYNRVDPKDVGKIYAENDILIKTSLLESFSYPPLEMMATGGLSVVLPNGGNAEYLNDRANCLFYKQGDIEDGVAKVMELVSNRRLREELIKNGLATAKSYDWINVEKNIAKLYK